MTREEIEGIKNSVPEGAYISKIEMGGTKPSKAIIRNSTLIAHVYTDSDAEFIRKAPYYIQNLLAHIDQLEAENKIIRHACNDYKIANELYRETLQQLEAELSKVKEEKMTCQICLSCKDDDCCSRMRKGEAENGGERY